MGWKARSSAFAYQLGRFGRLSRVPVVFCQFRMSVKGFFMVLTCNYVKTKPSPRCRGTFAKESFIAGLLIFLSPAFTYNSARSLASYRTYSHKCQRLKLDDKFPYLLGSELAGGGKMGSQRRG